MAKVSILTEKTAKNIEMDRQNIVHRINKKHAYARFYLSTNEELK